MPFPEPEILQPVSESQPGKHRCGHRNERGQKGNCTNPFQEVGRYPWGSRQKPTENFQRATPEDNENLLNLTLEESDHKNLTGKGKLRTEDDRGFRKEDYRQSA